MQLKYLPIIIEKLKDNKQVFVNFFYLGISYSTNLLLPLLVLPFLVKTIGIEKYGLISVAQAIMMFVNIFVDYGFNLTATREIAISGNDNNKKKYLFSVVIITKFLLFCIALIAICGYSFIRYSYNTEYKLLLYSMPIVFGQMLTPQWFFQGIEKIQYVAFANVFFKTLSIISIFFLIKTPEDYIYVNLLQGIGGCLAGILCTGLIFTHFKIKVVSVTFKDIKYQIVEGWYIFTANLANSIYIYSNIIILQIFALPEIVGYYSVAEKISNSLKLIMSVVTQATYPTACKLADENHQKLVSFLKQVFIPLSTILFAICFLLYIYADFVANIIVGDSNPEIINYIHLMAFIPFIVFINSPAYQTLLAHHLNRACSRVLILGAVLNLFSNTILSYYFSAYGTIISIILTELFVTITLYVLLSTKYKKYTLF